MSISDRLNFDLSETLLDVFDLDDAGLTVESLTAGHGMTEVGASLPFCAGSCTCYRGA